MSRLVFQYLLNPSMDVLLCGCKERVCMCTSEPKLHYLTPAMKEMFRASELYRMERKQFESGFTAVGPIDEILSPKNEVVHEDLEEKRRILNEQYLKGNRDRGTIILSVGSSRYEITQWPVIPVSF